MDCCNTVLTVTHDHIYKSRRNSLKEGKQKNEHWQAIIFWFAVSANDYICTHR